MYIKDLTTGKVREYGADKHDALRVSEDGKSLSFEHLQNGDGSYGNYRFCEEDGRIPMEITEAPVDVYFNIGGFTIPNEIKKMDGGIREMILQEIERRVKVQICQENIVKHIDEFVKKKVEEEVEVRVNSQVMKTLNEKMKKEFNSITPESMGKWIADGLREEIIGAREDW